MPRTVLVRGRFQRHGQPVGGVIRFTPSRMWVVQDEVHWACLAPTISMGWDGEFAAWLTPTDTDEVPWHYEVISPAGKHYVEVPYAEHGHTLRSLFDAHRAQPSP